MLKVVKIYSIPVLGERKGDSEIMEWREMEPSNI